MGSKHDILTEEELEGASINGSLKKVIDDYLAENSDIMPGKLNILDWGCGRGRSVILLRDMGFNAFGIDIDEKTLRNGYPLFQGRGLNPSEIIFHVDNIKTFPDGFFNIIFSEQVVEHVGDLDFFVLEQLRLTQPGGIGLHTFPGSRWVNEPHLNIPYVHWLPKNKLRKLIISLALKLGKGPHLSSWPETKGKSFSEICDIFYQYLHVKTHYRDIETVVDVFKSHVFNAEYNVLNPSDKKYIPANWLKNGWPHSQIELKIRKKSIN